MRKSASLIVAIIFAANSRPLLAEGWLPPNGLYVDAGRDYAEGCLEFDGLTLDFKRMSTGGPDSMCKILSLSRVTNEKINLKMSCVDVANPEDHIENAIVERIDDNKLFYRETENNKWKRPRSEMIYCGEDARRAYEEIQSDKLK